MKKQFKNNFISIALFILVAFISFSCNSSSNNTPQQELYICPMHPQVQQHTKGICPICFMDLEKKVDNVDVSNIQGIKSLSKETNNVIIGKFKTTYPKERSVSFEQDFTGFLETDPKAVMSISTKTSGRIQNLNIKYINQVVKEGEKLFDIYSPDLIATQRELLLSKKNKDSILVKQLYDQLLLMGMEDTEIDNVLTTEKTVDLITVYAPWSGVIHLPSGSASAMQASSSESTSSGMGGSMGGGSSSSQPSESATAASTTELIKENAYVSKGQTIFNIISHNKLRANIFIPSNLIGNVHLGDALVISTSGTQTKLNAKVDFLQTIVDEKTQQPSIWAYINTNNNGSFSPGALINAKLYCKSVKDVNSIQIPITSVTYLGEKTIVWVSNRSGTEATAREVSLGIEHDGWIEIKSGLKPSEKVVVDAHFVVDSDSFIKISTEKKALNDSSRTVVSNHDNSINLSESQMLVSNISLENPEVKTLSSDIIYSGITSFNKQKQNSITAKLAGRIEKLYFKNIGQRISQGDILYELFSEELIVAQQEYINILDNNDYALVKDGLERKFLYWGLTDKQITSLQKDRKVLNVVPIYSKFSGVITKVSKSDGNYLSEGEEIFDLSEIKNIWIEFDNPNVNTITKNTEFWISTTADFSNKAKADVVYFDNTINQSSQTRKVILTMQNKLNYPSGLLVYIMVKNKSTSSLVVPSEAIVSEKGQYFIWKEVDKGIFMRQKITKGIEENGLTQILEGVSVNDVIVVTGTYLLNSEYSIRYNY